MPLLAKNLKKSFKKRLVVKGVSVEVERGEIVGLLGPNGAGKTTTFYMIAGFLYPDEGRIYLNDEDITDLDVAERAKRGIVYLPQESSVFRSLTVEENLRMGLEGGNSSSNGFNKRELFERYVELFELKELLKQKAHHLSGGEKRRVEVVRALLTEPLFILLDEPFAGIDPIGISQLKKLFKTLKEANIGLIISDHNVRDTLQTCDRAYVIADGEIIGSGDAKSLVENSLVREKYLGQEFRI
jgi:lipopolysaccharide export system ATP-binding protein